MRSIATLQRMRFQRACRFLCLMRLRVAWTRRLRPWVKRSVSRAFAYLLVIRLESLVGVCLLQLGLRRLLSRRRSRSVRLRIGLLQGVLAGVLLLRLLSLMLLDLSSRCFLSLALVLLPLLVVGLALLRLTLLGGLCLLLLQLAFLLFALLPCLALTFQQRVRLDCLFALRMIFALRLCLLEVLAHLCDVLLLRNTILLFAFLSRLRRDRGLHLRLEVEHLLRTRRIGGRAVCISRRSGRPSNGCRFLSVALRLTQRLPDVLAAGHGHHASHPIAAALEVRDGTVIPVLPRRIAL